MELIPPGLKIDFVRYRKVGAIVSLVAILVSLASVFALRGVRLGIDFAGGIEMQVRFEEPVTIEDVRDSLRGEGLDVSVQNFGETQGSEYLVRIGQPKSGEVKQVSSDIRHKILDRFSEEGANVVRVEIVGPQVGEDLRQQGVLSILFALVGILVYVTFRFELRYALGSIAALVHDVILVVGFFSLTGHEFNLPTIAALLTIIGYSLNDTIVIFDRVRENRNRNRRSPLSDVINGSINETLSRTLLTSITTLLTVWALLFFTQVGSIIHDFALALFVGVVVGTYSTVFVASPVVLLWERNR